MLSGTEEALCPEGFPWLTDRPIAIVDVPGRGLPSAEASSPQNSNKAQIDITKDLVNGFLAAGSGLEDTVLLCTYKDLVGLYEKDTEFDPSLRGVIVKTVDGSQGSEWPYRHTQYSSCW